ncbi:MAG: hypothetical protein DRN37_00670 [Thermoplasmata archaeon]|nr:MAG: hypothetical protein DRG82_10430 [Deltaproteobacteria bacterium]RLF61607.1 MAG: hypothetical protein DRN37_00670 [Thermoplasmata archaeon]
MQAAQYLDREEKDRLKELITFFGYRVPHLQMVKVDKMIYITQLYHYGAHGELVTNAPFLSLSRGPHSPVIKSVMEELIKNRTIYIEENPSEIESANPCLLIKCDSPSTPTLPAAILNTLEAVLKEWGKEKFGKVLDYLTRTIPFISTPYRNPIDFRKIPPFTGLQEVLDLRQRTLIHRFVKSPWEEVGDGRDSRPDRAPVSIHEILEIYLCLCGTAPQGILSHDYHGFDVKKVLEILQMLDHGDGQGLGKKETLISKATECTHLLARSGCFKYTNEKVAFQAGMFFLKKMGYRLDQDFLKTNSFNGKGYQETKAWFERIIKEN